MKDGVLRAMGAALDGLDVGLCAFDVQDRTLHWNTAFLDIFPDTRAGCIWANLMPPCCKGFTAAA